MEAFRRGKSGILRQNFAEKSNFGYICDELATEFGRFSLKNARRLLTLEDKRRGHESVPAFIQPDE